MKSKIVRLTEQLPTPPQIEYVYFRGGGKSFKVIKRLPKGKIEICVGNSPQGPKTRILDVKNDEVTTAPATSLGPLHTEGFAAGMRNSRRVRA